MAIEANPDGSTQTHFRPTLRHRWLRGAGFLQSARRSRGSSCQTAILVLNSMRERRLDPLYGIGVSPDGKTLWVTSIPQNAIFAAIRCQDLNLVGQVALPELKLPGRSPGGAVPNWVTFAPDSRTVYISNAGLRSVTAVDTQTMKVRAVISVGGSACQAHQYTGYALSDLRTSQMTRFFGGLENVGTRGHRLGGRRSRAGGP